MQSKKHATVYCYFYLPQTPFINKEGEVKGKLENLLKQMHKENL